MSSRFVLTALLLVVGMAMPAAAQTSERKRTAAERTSQRGVPYTGSEEAMRWADDLAQRKGLDPDWVRRAVGRAQFLPTVARLMQPAPAGTSKNWRAYRSRFIDPVRIAAGVRFWQDNRATLERAAQTYGVPPEIVVGILGVETVYGQQMGNFRVVDALATLAFNFPSSHPRAVERSAYFRSELENFLVLQNQRQVDPLTPLGSYAGAMGMAQFMPSSWARWAVDFDGDGRIDLAASPADAIGSVANYFKSYGWRTGLPTHYPVSFDASRLDMDALLAPDILPTFSVASFVAKGAVLQGPALSNPGSLALVELQNGGDPPSYVAGTENFYVITRYNWSSYYAMAVIELGREVQKVTEGLAAMEQRRPSVPDDDPAAPADAPAVSDDSAAAPAVPPAPAAQAESPAALQPLPVAPEPAAAPAPQSPGPDAPGVQPEPPTAPTQPEN